MRAGHGNALLAWRISSASSTARATTGMRRARAASTSGLSACTAVLVTTACAPSMWLRIVADEDAQAQLPGAA
jgi:hypothetical protein